MKALPILQALAALEAVRMCSSTSMPEGIWSQCMKAAIALESAVWMEGLTIPVEAPQTEQVAA
jgi:hypothetical protein